MNDDQAGVKFLTASAVILFSSAAVMRQNRASEPRGGFAEALSASACWRACSPPSTLTGTRVRPSQTSSLARVSHVARFYEYFTDKDDCFLALYRDISGRLFDQIADAVNDSPPERAATRSRSPADRTRRSEARASAVSGQRRAGRRTPRTAGARAHDRPDQLARSKRRMRSLHPQTPAPDLPTQAVIGATQWLIAQRMRRGERHLTQLTRELTRVADTL